MKRILLLLLVALSVSASAQNYVTVTDECPLVRFTNPTIQDIAIDKKDVRIHRTSTLVVASLLNGTNQAFTWDSIRARRYGLS